MTFQSKETSRFEGSPFDLYLVETSTETWTIASGDVSRTYLGRTYTPDTIERTEIAQNQESHSGEIKITIPRTHDIASRFVSYIPVSPMSVVIFRGHDLDPSGEIVMNFSGRVVKAEFDDDCVLTVAPESDLLRKRVPAQKFQSQCNWVLYGGGCGVDRGLYSLPVVLSGVATDILTSATFATKPDGYFQNGYIERGQERRMILTHTGNTIRLIAPISGLASGETITAFPGCNRTTSDCATRYSNLEKFWGFDRIPTRNPFDGGLE